MINLVRVEVTEAFSLYSDIARCLSLLLDYQSAKHCTADLYCDATNQTLGSVSLPQTLCFTMQLGPVLSHTLGCVSFLEYMGFVLVVFPLKCGFIIVLVPI